MNTPSSSLPIGIFDSGLGGLTVLSELRRSLPGEDFIYLGDVARLPYGTKSQKTVSRYAGACARFLFDKPVKAVVVACNTATAMALRDLQAASPGPVLGVINPGVVASLKAAQGKRVLVLATDSTVRSEAYIREFQRLSEGTTISQLACPLLVPLAEEGWFDHNVTSEVARQYLAGIDFSEIGAVLLGCTHYPLLLSSLRQVIPDSVPITHGATVLAEQLKEQLASRGLLSGELAGGKVTFLSTDSLSRPLPLLQKLFAHPVHFETVDL